MILYLESQLQQAYRVYCTKIPINQAVPDIEFFRTMIEEMPDAEFFEELLDEYEELGSQKGTH
tara:strand:+ start:279 stop:467 length:189 start_codon:yes stop_codon:yes gene_type:complete